MSNKKIYVTQPFLPPLDEFSPYLERIWKNKILTNSGPYHQQLEDALCSYLGVQYISLFTNATIALITALKALDIQGEVITTPYSFVATAHSLQWNGITPVFIDNKCYIDGGMGCNYPLNYCIESGKKPDEILGFKNKYKDEKENVNSDSTMLDFLLSFVFMLI
jgi:hypothetical protein